MKDSKTIRNEHQTFVDAWKKIQEDNSSTPVEEGYGKVKDMLKTNKGYKKESKVLVRKSNAFTALAEKYNMSPKQFGRYVEANQHLFDIPTRKKAILANKFQGFKETKEWDEFFGDLELVNEGAPYTVNKADQTGNTPAYQNYKKGMLNKLTGKPLYKPGIGVEKASYEPEGEELQEITTKDTKSGTKFKVRVKDKKTNSSYIRFATRDKIAQLRSDPKIASVEMTDEGQTPEERGEKKAQAAGGGSPKKAKKDYDGDGKVETGSQEYLGSRDKAIKKAMKKRSVTTEKYMPSNPQFVGVGANKKYKESDSGTTSYGHINSTKTGFTKGGAYSSKFGKDNPIGKSEDDRTRMGQEQKKKIAAMKPTIKSSYDTSISDWREDLKEIMGEVEKTEGKKSKSKKKNGICINPDTDDEKNKYEEVNAQKVAENLGAELQSLKIEDADGNVAYEVIDLVKPDPIKEKVELTYKTGDGVGLKVGGRDVKKTYNNIKTGVEVAKNIKKDGFKKTFNKYTSGNNNSSTKPTISQNIDSAIKNYKSSI